MSWHYNLNHKLSHWVSMLSILLTYFTYSRAISHSLLFRPLIIDSFSNLNTHTLIDDNTYEHYALQSPRSYSLIVFLTATHPKFKCHICNQLDKEYRTVSEAYNQYLKMNPTESRQLFFIRLDYENSKNIFNNYKINSVPLLFHISSSGSKVSDNFMYDINPRDQFHAGTYSLPTNTQFIHSLTYSLIIAKETDAESIATFIKDHSGIHIPIQRSMIWLYLTLVTIFGGIAFLIPPIINRLPLFLSILRHKPTWFMICILFYLMSTAGVVFDILRNPPMYHQNHQTGILTHLLTHLLTYSLTHSLMLISYTGQVMFFYPQSGSQFVMEGFIIGFLNILCAISLIVMSMYAPAFKSESTKNTVLIIGFIVFFFCFTSIRGLYKMKNRWYGSM